MDMRWLIVGAVVGGGIGATAAAVLTSDANHVGNLAEWAAAIGTVGALVYLAIQSRESSRVARLQSDLAILQAHNAMTELTLGMNDRFRDRPELLPYFVKDVEVEESTPEEVRHQARYAALAFCDFIDTVTLHHKMLPSGHFETWVRFCRDTIAASPVVRQHLDEDAEWYSPETAELLKEALQTRAAASGTDSGSSTETA